MKYGLYNTIGNLDNAPDNSILNHILKYMADILSKLNAEPDENENAITNKFCIALNKFKPPEYPFFFHHQNIEDVKKNTSTDFAVFGMLSYSGSYSNALIKFEAKRLSNLIKGNREKEYVIGEYKGSKRIRNSGGIERFKNEQHGKDVNIACLIGYVQTNSCQYWFNKVNEWIQDEILKSHDKDLVWNKKDKLAELTKRGRISAFNSTSIRISQEEINLLHIWINFSQTN